MPDNSEILAEVGFADFVAVLLVETLDSIIASHTSQEERLRALDSAASLSVEEFAAGVVTDEMVDATLARLFPDGEGGTTIVQEGPVPAKADLSELGVDLGPDDVQGRRLTESGVAAVRAAVVLHVARTQRAAVQKTASRGVPRVYVDGGTLRAKVNINAVRAAQEPEPTTPSSPGTRTPERRTPLVAASRLQKLDVLNTPIVRGVVDSIRTTRLQVVQAGAEPGGTATSTANVSGEIEIRFRTEL